MTVQEKPEAKPAGAADRRAADLIQDGGTARLHLTMASADYDHIRDLVHGVVRADGIALTPLVLEVEEIFHRFIKNLEWDVSEISFAKYTALTAQGGAPMVAIPVFPSRVFRHSSIYIRTDRGIAAPKDLENRTVGIPEWAQTAAVYSRGTLQHEYKIDLTSIEWIQAGVNQPGRREKVELKLPKGIKLTPVADKSLNEMLLSGEIDCAMVARAPEAFVAGDRKIMRLFENFLEVEADYYKKTGIFPIMHAVAVKREVLEKNPWVARSLFTAFDEAKRRSVERAVDSTVTLFPIPWCYEYARRGMDLLGKDYFPYGIEPNRKTLEAFLKYAHEQGVCRKLLTVDELFPKSLASSYRV